MNTPLRFGFIGAGAISHYSADSVRRHPHAQVIAAQDTHPGRLKELLEAKGIPRGYATAAELFADPEVDAVYIAVPNKFHVPLAIEALAAGKHVLLEKPFAMNLAEAEQAAQAAKRAGKVLTLAMNQRFDKHSQQFRALVAEGAFGEIYHVKAYWFRRSGIPRLGTWFGDRALAGGGCLYDIGVHLLDLSLYLIGNFEPVSVFGSTYTKFGNRGLGEGGWGISDRSAQAKFDVEDFATGQIRLANGVTISLDVSWACHQEPSERIDVEIYGTEAGGAVFAGKIHRRLPDGAHVTYGAPERPLIHPHKDRFHNFINHLQTGEPLCVSIEQALTVQRILDALAASSASGKSIQL
jgi:predicted dehydrogenase